MSALKTVKPYLVLVENEVTVASKYDFWDDHTGVRYQYPNSYRNLVRPNTPFVYYRGVRRKGGRRGRAEYFGMGVIGDVWPDSTQEASTRARKRRWFCSIEGYTPFPEPVAAASHGVSFEGITSSMGWRNGVRAITQETYDAIIHAAGFRAAALDLSTPLVTATVSPTDCKIETIQDGSSLILPRPKAVAGRKRFTAGLRSKRAAAIGRWAEELVHRHFCETLSEACCTSLDWHSKRGDTPGWDISYLEAGGERLCVEVKATTLSQFTSIEMTANEWAMAMEKGHQFTLCLVTGACTPNARIGFIRDLSALAKDGKLVAAPSSYRLNLEK